MNSILYLSKYNYGSQALNGDGEKHLLYMLSILKMLLEKEC